MKVFKSVSICDSLKLQCTSCHRYRRIFEIGFQGFFESAFVTSRSATAETAHVFLHKLQIAKNYRLWAPSVADSMGLAPMNLMQLAPKSVTVCEITHNDGHRVVQGQ